jgi:tRNA-binding protein
MTQVIQPADFAKVDIRIGTILEVFPFPKAKKPAWQLHIDFGPEIGIKRSSAQITQKYDAQQLLGKQVLAVVNFPPKQIAHFSSEVLVLGLDTEKGVVLLSADEPVSNGLRVV